jgi:hypothetical protein
MAAQLSDCYLAASNYSDRLDIAEAHQKLVASLLRLQEAWTDDPVPAFFTLGVRPRVNGALQVALEYILTRVADLPTTEAVKARSTMFQQRFGAATRRDMATLTAQFALDLRQQAIAGQPHRRFSATERSGA